MVRNLDRRIEVTCPIHDPSIKKELDDILNIQFADNVKARRLQPDGHYKVVKEHKKKDIRSQYELYNYYKQKSKTG